METADIIKKLDALYASDKSKNFVLHLVRAYLPVHKAKKVFFKPDDVKSFRCSLTGAQHISVAEILDVLNSDEYKEGFAEDLKEFAKKAFGDESKDNEPYVPLLKRLCGKRIFGFQGEKTSTYLCQDAIIALYEWTTNKILGGDKKLNWTLRDMSGFNKPSGNNQRHDRPQPQPVKPATYTIGDAGLAALKSRLELDESGESK